MLVYPRQIDYVRGVGKGWYEELEGLIEEDIERMIEEEIQVNVQNGDAKEKKKKREEKENTFSWYECAGCLCEWFCVM